MKRGQAALREAIGTETIAKLRKEAENMKDRVSIGNRPKASETENQK